MASALIYLVVVLAVAAVIFLVASAVFGRGEQLDPLPPGSTPTRLPASDVVAADVRALRFQQVFRGYKASEVDWALERLAGEVEDLHGRIGVLERQLDLADEQRRPSNSVGSGNAEPGSDAESGGEED